MYFSIMRAEINTNLCISILEFKYVLEKMDKRREQEFMYFYIRI